MYIITTPSKFGNRASHADFDIIWVCTKRYYGLLSFAQYVFHILAFYALFIVVVSATWPLGPFIVGEAVTTYRLYSSSASIAAEIILLLTRFEEFKNIFVSFGRQCPPIPSRGSSMFTFHLVLRALRSSQKSTPLAWQ